MKLDITVFKILRKIVACQSIRFFRLKFLVSIKLFQEVGNVNCTCTWLPFLIGQVWCRPYLAANFGLFELQMFPWSLSKVEVGTF